MKIKQPLCYRFLGFWSLCSAAMTALFFIIIGGGTLWKIMFVIIMGAFLGCCSALIAWKFCKKPQWGIISLLMLIAALLIALLEWLMVVTCIDKPDLQNLFLASYWYIYVILQIYPLLLPYIILIFVINYFLIKKLTHDEKEEREFEEVWKEIAGQG